MRKKIRKYVYFLGIVAVSETDGEEDENLHDNHELQDTFTSKPDTSHDTSFTSSAFKNISTFLHIGSHSNPSTSSNKNKRYEFTEYIINYYYF